MAGTTAWILGDQLSHAQPGARGRRPGPAGRVPRQAAQRALAPPEAPPGAQRDAPLRRGAGGEGSRSTTGARRRWRPACAPTCREHRPEAGAPARPHSSSRAWRRWCALDRVECVDDTLFLTSPARVRGLGRRPSQRLGWRTSTAGSAGGWTCSWTATSPRAGAGTSTPRTASRRRTIAARPHPTGRARTPSTTGPRRPGRLGLTRSATTGRGCGRPPRRGARGARRASSRRGSPTSAAGRTPCWPASSCCGTRA